jgi:hypothetical protein
MASLGPLWKSEGLMVPRKPVNAGGGTEPWFGQALEGGEDRGIAERLKPNLSSTSGRSSMAAPNGKRRVFAAKDQIVAFSRACAAVKPVREPDAGDLQVRFDERRWETELRPRLRHRHQGESRRKQRLPRPTDTAPAADSTLFREHLSGGTCSPVRGHLLQVKFWMYSPLSPSM